MVGFLKKLKDGLKKSSNKIQTGLVDVFVKKRIDDESLEHLEEALIVADMGVKVATKIVTGFAKNKFDKEISEEELKTELASNIEDIITDVEKPLEINDNNKPHVILMAGVNGAGKTTSIGKLAKKYTDMGRQVSLIAADTFRMAAIEQLKVWGDRCGVEVYHSEIGADAAGLCFDGLTQAIKNGDDIVFIDTAGRLQNKAGLMDELKKVVKVIKKVIPEAPHNTILTIDATVGQNAISQVKTFKEMIDINGIVITKLDGSAKGGILVAVSEEFGIPVHFIGVGEKIEDLQEFKAKEYSKSLVGLNS